MNAANEHVLLAWNAGHARDAGRLARPSLGRAAAAGSRSASRSPSPCSARPGSWPGQLTPDLTPIHLPGLTEAAQPADLLPILWRNSLVLALHGFACLAGFIAGASMPIAADQRTGISRWVHVKTAEFAILFVCAVTLFSLCTQALYLGFQGSTIAFQLDIPRLILILTVLPHAMPGADARCSCRSPPG